MKVVLDTSVLFSAFLTAPGATRHLFERARFGDFELCLSEAVLRETAATLLRKQNRYEYGRKEVNEYVALLTMVATIVEDLPDVPSICRDADDEHVIAAAVAAGAEFIVTGDDDLLALQDYQGIRILSVFAFLDSLAD